MFSDPVNFIDQDGLLPSVPQGVVNFFAGLGDGITFGLTDKIRDAIDVNGSVNKCTGAFKAGGFAGLGLVGGGAGVVLKGGLKAGGFLNSNRYLRVGQGMKNGKKVFRVSGNLVKKVKKNGHINITKPK